MGAFPLSKMLKITIWKNGGGEPEKWLYWANRYFFDSQLASREEIGVWARGLMDFESAFYKPNVNIVGASAVAGFAENGPDQMGTHFTYTTNGHGLAYRRSPEGELKYRFKLGVRKETIWGRHTHTRYTGSITESDIWRDHNGRIALKPELREYFDQWIRDCQENQPFWFREVAMVSSGGLLGIRQPVRVTKRYGSFAIDAHAHTRWRPRTSTNGKPLFQELTGLPLAIEAQIPRNQQYLNYEIDYLPAVLYKETIALISSTVKQHEKLDKFLKDADYDSNNEEKPPITRNGSTGAKHIAALGKWKSYVENLLPELQQVHKPFTYADGMDYIKYYDLQPYQDILEEMQDALSTIWEFDFYNPFAYEKNSENWTEFNQMPDIIELDY